MIRNLMLWGLGVTLLLGMGGCGTSPPRDAVQEEGGMVATDTPVPPPTATEVPLPSPTDAPTATATARPTSTEVATATPTAPPPRPTGTSAPAATAPPATLTPPSPAQATNPPPAVPVGVVGTFLADSQRTQADLSEIKIWFDRLAAGERVQCSTVSQHAIHTPSSTAPATVEELVPIWNEYQQAIAQGQQCFQWLLDFCASGGGMMDVETFWDQRTVSANALSHVEHVVHALEER
jgi:hypothetical protein